MNRLYLAAAILSAMLTATMSFGYALPVATAQEQQPEHEVTVESIDQSGEELTGMWFSIRLGDGEYFGSGYTPLAFPAESNETYILTLQNYDGITFDQWEDGSTNSTRTLTIEGDTNSTVVTAQYDVGDSMMGTTPINFTAGGPTLTVEAMAGNETVNAWVVVDPGNSTETEATYTVYPGHHENHIFDSWDDGNTTRVRTLTITENTTITANYVEAEHTITIPFGAFDPENPPYLPEVLTVERGDTVVVFNEDTAPHSVTSGTGPEDPTAANLFETGLMFEGQYAHVETEDLDAGDYDYYCFVHPFMQGVLTVTE
jgi:plastocyanin